MLLPFIDPPAVSAFSNKIEMQWKGVTDPGSGMYLYRLFRKGPGDPGYAFYQNLYHPTFADTVNVNPSSTYEYAVYTTDAHDNWSARGTSLS